MNKLTIALENCFGINKLAHEFDFAKSNTQLVYASNGVMKTSFAETFLEISKGRQPKDRLFQKPSTHQLMVDGTPLAPDFVHVIKSFDSINTTKSQTRLLVDEERKQIYDEIIAELAKQKRTLIADLNRKSGIKQTELENQICQDFETKDFFKLLRDFLASTNEPLEFDIKYSEIINRDVLDFLSKPEVQKNIDEYFVKYNDLIEKSTVFKKGVFNPNQADNVSKTLKKENYFSADHKLRLHGIDEEFSSHKELSSYLLEERSAILQNEELLAIEKQITKVAVKNLQQILERYPIVNELKDLDTFKKKLWYRYLEEVRGQIEFLLIEVDSSHEKIKEIEEAALEQSPRWESVIDKFKQRFFVPFRVRIKNKAESILGRDVPQVEFVFTDEDTGLECTKTQNELEGAVLSQGERRAMYLLNVLFDIEARREDALPTLFILDDVADSFDYKNKYAIVEYIKELTEEENFYQIILTHNYDFYRTIFTRVLSGYAKYHCSFSAIRTNDEIILVDFGGRKYDNPFEEWKKNLNQPKFLISSIPFVRNIIEYSEGDNHDDYTFLTALLHIKEPRTSTIKIKDVKEVFERHVTIEKLEQLDQENNVKDLIFEKADEYSLANIPTEINLEHKIVLSIGTRLRAEEYMWSKVSDQSPINNSQTWKLLKRYKADFPTGHDVQIKTIEKVILNTAENIHLNSFMFEPLIDLSLNHLQKIYIEVKANCPS